MKTKYLATATVVIASLFLAAPRVNADPTEEAKPQQVDGTKQAKDAADRAEKREKQGKGETNYDVKKSHDEHIKATEKAAAKAEQNKKKKPNDK